MVWNDDNDLQTLVSHSETNSFFYFAKQPPGHNTTVTLCASDYQWRLTNTTSLLQTEHKQHVVPTVIVTGTVYRGVQY